MWELAFLKKQNHNLRKRPQGARTLRRSLQKKSSPSRHGYFQSEDQLRLFYGVEGEGLPLLFCQGLVCSSLHWTYQIEHFKENYQTIWMDYRAHGNSQTPKDLSTLTVSQIAKDCIQLLDELKIKETVLLGHSMGVNIVLEIYREIQKKQPSRIKGLVLANGTPRRPLESMFHNNSSVYSLRLLRKFFDLSPNLARKLWKLQKNSPITYTATMFGGFNPHLAAKEDIRYYIDQVFELDLELFLLLFENYAKYDATPWLEEIKTPTLIIGGEKDHMTPLEGQRLMHQLIPSSQLEIIPEGSHCSQMDLPELVSLKIEKFLRKIDYRTKEPLEKAPA